MRMEKRQMLWNFGSFADNIAVIGECGETLRYGELEALSAKLSEVDPRYPLVMMLCRNTFGAISGYAALLGGGYPMLMMSAEAPAEIRRSVLNAYRPGLVFLPEEMRGEYAGMREACTVGDYVLLRTNYPELYPVHPELGLLLTTSGSTGSVKYVRQSRKNILFNAGVIADYLGLRENDRSVTSVPMQYTYAQSMIHAALLRGAATVATRQSFMENEFWDLVEEKEVSVFHGVPNTYEILRQIDLFSEDFPSLRTLTQAGGKLSRELHAYFADYAAKTGRRFVVMYGQSEATAAISWLAPEKSAEKIGSVGLAVPGGEISLLDAQDHTITAPHCPGEIVYRGGNVAMGYARGGEDLCKGDEWGGILRTGDVGETDEDGYLYIVGRLKRFIKVSGHRISLDEIDEKMMSDLNILTVSSGIDEHLIVFVTDEREKNIVEDYIRRKIAVVRRAFSVSVIPEIPRNDAGKVLYGELLERAKALIAVQHDGEKA